MNACTETIVFSVLLLMGAVSANAQDSPSASSAPTLDDAIYIYATVDKENVYLGEGVELKLEYWELQFRGMRVQPHYNTAQPKMPDTEGFYAGAPEREEREATRDGGLYTVTTYRSQLYPARAGTLRIGAWTWTGTVRGHTATGAQSRTIDLSTPPLSVRVRPLPDPPATFDGAVGELDIALEFESREWARGEPVAATVTLSGTGNPHAVRLPSFPEEPWFSTGDPTVEDAGIDAPDGAAFIRRFRVVVMPLAGGEHTFPPLSLTYFSPSEARYKVVRTAPVPVSITGNGPADTLVVIGGGHGGSGPELETMDEGRFPIVTNLERVRIQRERGGYGVLLVMLPPLAFLMVFIATFDRRAWRQRRKGRARKGSGDERLAAIAHHPRPFDALNAVARDILSERIGRDAASMSIPEIRDAVADVAPEGVPESVASALGECESQRYGQGQAEVSGLIDRMRGALQGVPGARSAGRRWW